MTRTARIGIIGYGMTARHIVDYCRSSPQLVVDFVHARDPAKLSELPPECVVADLDQVPGRTVDLIIEAAHPDYVSRWGSALLRTASFAPLSVGGLADDAVREELLATAKEHGTSLLVPRGALVGLSTLKSNTWHEVSVEFVKNPDHFDWSSYPEDERPDTSSRQIVFEGSAREVAALFPRNANAMVTLALATVGLDALQCRIVSDPAQSLGVLNIEARADDGHSISVSRRQPMGQGYLFRSVLDILDRVSPAPDSLTFV